MSRCKICFKPKEDHSAKGLHCPTLVNGVYRKTVFEPMKRKERPHSISEHD